MFFGRKAVILFCCVCEHRCILWWKAVVCFVSVSTNVLLVERLFLLCVSVSTNVFLVEGFFLLCCVCEHRCIFGRKAVFVLCVCEHTDVFLAGHAFFLLCVCEHKMIFGWDYFWFVVFVSRDVFLVEMQFLLCCACEHTCIHDQMAVFALLRLWAHMNFWSKGCFLLCVSASIDVFSVENLFLLCCPCLCLLWVPI